MAQPPGWADDLGLEPHPEGGWYAETWRSGHAVEAHGTTRAAGTAIHFMLLAGESSEWHTVASAELWLHHRGSPLVLELGGPGREGPGDVTTHVLGPGIEVGERPQVLVPPGHWQRARPLRDEPALVSCVVVPGFDFADFRLLGSPPAAQ